MQAFMRVALAGSMLVSLVSCGGGDAPDDAPTTAEPQAQAASGTTRKTGTKKVRSGSKTAAKLAAPGAADGRTARKTYIVQLSEPPAAAYGGGITGYAATRPAKGSKLDARSPAVARYRSHLQSRHDAVLSRVGATKGYSYAYAFNGFSAQLSDAQADQLAAMPGVLAVSEDGLRKLDTASTPSFLGLSGRHGFWRGFGARGENVVIGLIDTGVWPELLSFSDRRLPRTSGAGAEWHRGPVYGPLRGWHGTCVTGEAFTAEHCNHKLIGARFYNAGPGGDARVKALFPYEYLSPRDFNGHGTHTASTAGGNADVPTTGSAAVFGTVSGVAPRARIAVYKACWGVDEPEAGCYDSDTVAAIDQAVEDGVDVINFSIGGTAADFLDPVEQAFLRAADAGVFVAASAGNSGPGAGTVAHPSPWITTVAAGTHHRNGAGSVTLGSGTRYAGASYAPAAVPATALINAADAGLPGADPTFVRQCHAAVDNGGSPVLDPLKVQGKIVVCDRGVTARVNKSLAVAEAGGVGMVLVNTSTGSLNADLHAVPTVHLDVAEGSAVKAYAAAGGATAAIAQATLVFDVPAPHTADFSSRGPSPAAAGNLLKPDISAPGQDILAGVAPPGNGGREFDVYSGTSMSSPHIAGIAALLKELHPRWSPMAIKSAMMTTAGDVLDGPDTTPAVIFAQGAGHVKPSSAADPGLVFDSDLDDWLGFLCGTTQLPAAECTTNGIPVLNPSDLNTASIAISALAGAQTVTRRVTNVSWGFATYTASVTGLAGYTVTMQPRALTLAPGQTRTVRFTITRTTAALNAYAGGQLTLTGGTPWFTGGQYKVRVPVVVRPVAFSAPSVVSGTYQVKFGYSGAFAVRARGLAGAGTQAGHVVTRGSHLAQVNVPAGTTLARFSLFDTHVTPASDLDLWVTGPDGGFAGASLGFTSEEQVDVVNPAPGIYTVEVFGYAVPGSTGADFTLFDWSLGSGLAGNMTVTAPAAAVTGATGTIRLGFTGLVPGTRYLGLIDYDGGAISLPGPTTVRVGP